MARAPRPAGQAHPLLVLTAVVAIVVFGGSLAVALLRPEGLPLLGVLVVVFGLIFAVVARRERRGSRHLTELQEQYPVAHLIREPVPVRENAFITSDTGHVRLWRLDGGSVVQVLEIERAQCTVEAVAIQVTPVKRGPGLELSGDGVGVEFAVLRDVSGLVPRRLSGTDLDRAAEELRRGVAAAT